MHRDTSTRILGQTADEMVFFQCQHGFMFLVTKLDYLLEYIG